MNRIINYSITNEYDGKKIGDFLRLQDYTTRSLREIKKDWGTVRLNGEPTWMTMRLKEGDALEIELIEHDPVDNIVPTDLPFPIVYEDEDIVVINKPPFMPIHPSIDHYENSLANAAAFYFASKGETHPYRCVNRLDRDTTGLTILAKNFLASGILGDQIKERKVKRIYTAIAEGEDLPDRGTVTLPISRKPDSILERWTEDPNGESALTNYRVLERRNGLSLLELELGTGRTHQIRVHMKAIGHPLIGDFLYNPDFSLIDRQALHAGSLAFTHPVTRKEMKFEAPLPEDMRRAFYRKETEHE